MKELWCLLRDINTFLTITGKFILQVLQLSFYKLISTCNSWISYVYLNTKITEEITFQYLHWLCPLLSVEEKQIALSNTKERALPWCTQRHDNRSRRRHRSKSHYSFCNSKRKEMEKDLFLCRCYSTMKIMFKATYIFTCKFSCWHIVIKLK